MAELRCLVCNNVNPDNADTCQFCGARLRQPTVPLGPIKAGEAPTPKNTSDLESTLPGWLRDIRSEGAADDSAGSSGIKPSADLFADKKLAPPPAPKAKAPSPSDFLAGLSSAASDDDDEVPDWLASIKAPEAPPPPAPAAPPPPVVETPKPKQPERLDFGFAAGDVWQDEGPQKPAPAEETSEDVADWLRTLDQGASKPPAQFIEPQAPAPSSFPPADSGAPDWLSSLEQTSAVPGPAAASDAPDWLASLEAPSSPAPAAPASDLPDWMSSLSEPATPSAPAAPASDLPDWMSSLSEPATPSAPATPAPARDIPDWMSSLSEPTTPSAPATPAPARDMPDWMSSLSEPAAPSESPASDMPDWMSSLSEPAAPSAPAAPASDMPDWMSSLGAPATPSTPAPIAQEPEAELPTFEAPSWLSEEPAAPAATDAAFPAQDMPAWLSNLSGAEAAAPAATPPPARPEPVPESPRKSAPAFAMDEKVNAEDAEALLSMDMPDWLTGMSPAETSTPQTSAESAEPAATISDVELPSWVQAMRPVESMMDTSAPGEDSYVEDKGPLAGLRDVLPAGALATPKPPAYANRLQLSESQQAQANLLETMITAEAEPKPITTEKKLGSARVLRWALALLMLLVVVAPVALGLQTVPTIDGTQPLAQSMAMVSAVNALQPNDPVLLVFDYEPGLSGELEAASMPVIEHMQLKGARLIAVSTSPTGSLLAERAFGKLRSDSYRAGENYANIGYLAGGVTGIANFAAAPRAAAPFEAWTTNALANVAAFGDFAAVVVLTDNADTGRAWIEQTAAHLNGQPLLMIASAQAEPMLWPYYNSQQVKGMVSGLNGGAFYEVQTGQLKLGRAYWDAFGYSMALAELAIVIGGIWSLIAHFRARKLEGDEA